MTPPAPSAPRVVFVQTAVPDYRTRFYEDLAGQIDSFTLISGADDWSPDIGHIETVPSAHVRNRYLPGRRLLWQSGVLRATASADVVVVSLNPRVVSSWIVLARRRLRGKPTLVWGHAWPRGGRAGRSDRIRDVFRRLASTVVVYTETEARELRAHRPGADVVAAPNALYRSAEIAPAHAEVATDILFVGRLNPTKKPFLLLEGFVLAAPRLPDDVRLLFVGDGPQRDAVEQRAAEAGLRERVVFTGHVSDVEHLRALYGRAIVAVSPGYVGLSLTQCLGYGIPMLIARDEPHSPEIEALVEGENGSLFPSDAPAALAESLVATVADRAAWLERRDAIAATVRSRYTIELMAGAFARALVAAGARKTTARTEAPVPG